MPGLRESYFFFGTIAGSFFPPTGVSFCQRLAMADLLAYIHFC